MTPDDVERAAARLRFPLIVKHPSSYSSIGMTRDSRVETPAALRREAERITAAFGSALIEEFVEGREFTVLVAENPDDPLSPTTYTPVEFFFPDGETFKHFDLKWVEYAEVRAAPVPEGALSSRLRELSAKVFRGLDGAGYGRVDVRVRADGVPFFLEINPNCGVYYPPSDPGSADICLLHDPAGHEGFTRQIVAAALRRRDLGRRVWEVRPTEAGGYGMFATRPAAPGERIVGFEQQPQVLVSRSHVERSWRDQDAAWFPRYAWPLTDEVYAVWERSPEDWKPINHSCEPNSWLDRPRRATRSLPERRSPSTTRPSATSSCRASRAIVARPSAAERFAVTTISRISSAATTVTFRTTSPGSGASADSASPARGC
jgi:D-alanine-D-alanine ligase